jgi:hypothetical protein
MVVAASSFGDLFRLILFTDDPILAAEADKSGVARIGIDFERLGKAARQAGHNTRLSQHDWRHLEAIAPVLRSARAFVRINPLHDGSAAEIETALSCGARSIMLPYFRTAAEVAAFVELVRGRAEAMILIETAAALVRIREVLAVRGVDEAMIGLNDLRFTLGVANHFEVLVSPLLDAACAELRRTGRPFSVGGVARANDGDMPIPSELVYAQFPRLGATGALITRAFTNGLAPDQFQTAVVTLRAGLSSWAGRDIAALEAAREELARRAVAWRDS